VWRSQPRIGRVHSSSVSVEREGRGGVVPSFSGMNGNSLPSECLFSHVRPLQARRMQVKEKWAWLQAERSQNRLHQLPESKDNLFPFLTLFEHCLGPELRDLLVF
jgi:hypothetical protein